MTDAADTTGEGDAPGAGEALADDAVPSEPYAAGDTLPLGFPDRATLPAKEFFKIGEVARLVGVKPYVLRYWESEFRRDIRPDRSRTNQRIYSRKDVETFLEIKRLRYEEKLELPGARKRLRTEPRAAKRATATAETAPETLMTTDATEIPTNPPVPEAAAPDLAALLATVPRTAAVVESMKRGLKELIRIVDEDEKRG